MITGSKGCANCKYRMTDDHGYSNWTVLSTEHTCLKSLNPWMPFDDDLVSSAVADRIMDFGKTCPGHVEGDGPHFDVDGDVTIEEACGDDQELLALVRAARQENPQ